MSNGFEIAGSCVTFAGAAWLSIDALLIRRHIRVEAGANEFFEILNKAGARGLVKDKSGKPLDSREDLTLWLAGRTVGWTWVGFGLMAFGFVLDLIGKLRS